MQHIAALRATTDFLEIREFFIHPPKGFLVNVQPGDIHTGRDVYALYNIPPTPFNHGDLRINPLILRRNGISGN
jgi:hypothetical protein